VRCQLSAEETRIKQMVEDIINNAKTEANQVLAEAKKQTNEIVKKGQITAEKEKQAILESQLKMVKEREKQKIASINLQTRREILLKKEEEINKAFDLAKVELKNFHKKAAYSKVLKGLIIEAGSALDGGNLNIFVRKEDKTVLKDLPTIAKEITKKCGNKCSLKISKDTIQTIGGVVVEKEDATIRIENTFEARLEQKQRLIRTQVANKLFG